MNVEDLSSSVALNVLGPFTCHSSSGRSLFDQPDADRSGVYMWTVHCDQGFRVYYLGQTGRSFATRMEEHILNYLSGFYRVWDVYALRHGKKEAVWQGMWKTSVHAELDEWLCDHDTLLPPVADFIKSLEIFVIPWATEKRMRERLEAAMAKSISKAVRADLDIQDPDVRHWGRRGTEAAASSILEAEATIIGLPRQLSF